MRPIKIAAFGDVVGESGVDLFTSKLGGFRKQNGIDLIVVNGENAEKANGISPETAKRLRLAGADVITSGNHLFRKKEILPFLDDEDFLLRPANYPSAVPGSGFIIVSTPLAKILVMNVMGCVFMDSLASPFETVEKILEENDGQYDLSVLDVHAEATSEKAAIARYFDGRIDAVFGTHTHVQTSDARVLPKGTGFITDLGMCGPTDSILGVEADGVIERFVTKMPVYFRQAPGPCALEGALFTLIPGEGCADVRSFRLKDLT
ncbi:MAG: YmdB family metallophosphoesterase [Clostridia bacterium]|nr:YmdB family metallophosphoesterase [Clostridia bacterium]